MKNNIQVLLFVPLLLLVTSTALKADTVTTTMHQDKVTVRQNPSDSATEPVVVRTVTEPVIVQPAPVVVVKPVVVTKVEDPRALEGEIIRVDYPDKQIVVEDIDGRERKVTLKQGMINSYKVGDYVVVYLMADLKEAKTITTKHTADLEGNIISIDETNGRMIILESNGSGKNVLVAVKPGLINNYKVGDRIRLYVVSDTPDFGEVRMIRVR